MQDLILHSIDEAFSAIQFVRRDESVCFIQSVAKLLCECFSQGGKLLVAGNGGSLCDAMHFAEELTGYFRMPRKALPAIALSEPGHLTCVANDSHFHDVFARSVEAYGKNGDVLVVLTTSGSSENLVRAVKTAKRLGLTVVCFLGRTGGKLLGVGDYEWVVPGRYSDRIQEAHMMAIHIIIEALEKLLSDQKSQCLKTHAEITSLPVL